MRYRYHWSFKLLALILAAVSGAVMVVGAAGMLLGELGYYESSRNDLIYNRVDLYCSRATNAVFDRFAWKDTGIEPKLFERFFRWGADVDAVDSLEYDFYYTIREQRTAALLESNYSGDVDFDWSTSRQMDVRRGFVTVMPLADHYPSFEEYTESRSSNLSWHAQDGSVLPELGAGVTDYEYYVVSDDPNVNWRNVSVASYDHAEADGADYTIYRIEYTHYDSYHVEVGLTAEQMVALMDEAEPADDLLSLILKEYEADYWPMILWGGLALALSAFWLALVAGKSPYREGVKPDGLNRVPLDGYLVAVAMGVVTLALLAVALCEEGIWRSYYGGFEGEDAVVFWLYAAGVALCGGGAGLLVAMLAMAASAQMKVGDNYWLKHTIVGLTWRWGWRFVKKIVGLIRGFFRGIRRFFRKLFDLLPLYWQWLLISVGLWMVMGFCCIVGIGGLEPWLIPVGLLVTVAAVLYGAYGFGVLRDGARKMSVGNLTEKIESKYLLGCFGEFAGHLNNLGEACTRAAREQMKSERMKTELITNVSHDIKTPLTSIINYVDLLQKTDDEDRRAEYLEVLDRQSQRLKKLIEDLMDMSKAASGNVSVEITPTDVTEAVNQALGEFSDILERSGLRVMYSAPAEPVMALCDGRHLWRVLGNCLSNTVKYAMPGTRVYVDVARRERQVEISLKNISAQMLNITAEELMERFVRGDSARNTEGNGLGLNIAKSLMELQGGRLDLTVDGDLFKVTLSLNCP